MEFKYEKVDDSHVKIIDTPIPVTTERVIDISSLKADLSKKIAHKIAVQTIYDKALVQADAEIALAEAHINEAVKVGVKNEA